MECWSRMCAHKQTWASAAVHALRGDSCQSAQDRDQRSPLLFTELLTRASVPDVWITWWGTRGARAGLWGGGALTDTQAFVAHQAGSDVDTGSACAHCRLAVGREGSRALSSHSHGPPAAFYVLSQGKTRRELCVLSQGKTQRELCPRGECTGVLLPFAFKKYPSLIIYASPLRDTFLFFLK